MKSNEVDVVGWLIQVYDIAIALKKRQYLNTSGVTEI